MPRKSKTWWDAFKQGEKEARLSARTGKPMKPLRVTLTPMQAERMGLVYDKGVALVPVHDLPGAKSLFPTVTRTEAKTCAHGKLKMWADNLAICWECGQTFEVEKL